MGSGLGEGGGRGAVEPRDAVQHQVDDVPLAPLAESAGVVELDTDGRARRCGA